MFKSRVSIGALLVVLTGFLLISPFLWRFWIEASTDSLLFDLSEAPEERVAIVFGARVYSSGRLSSMARDRIETAVQLYLSGKVDRILISGDNSSVGYNEPGVMLDYALSRGVPRNVLHPDFAGLRTYDTCYRAGAIFQVDSAILVTQRFHLPRAIFTCRNLGIDAVGVAADRRVYSQRALNWSEFREIPATFVALFDVVRRRPPTYLGDPIPIL